MKKFEKEYRNLEAQKNRNKDMPGVESYVKQKEKAAELKKNVKNWKRKIEIAEIASKECDRIIRRYQKEAEMMDGEME